MDVLAREPRREARAVHALVMLQRGEAHTFGDILVGAEDIETVACVVAIHFEVFALERLDILFQQALAELRLADVVHEARHDDVVRLLLRDAHPLGDDAREDGNAKRMVVDVAREMVQLVEIVDRAALLRHGSKIPLHHRRRALDRHLATRGDRAEDVLHLGDDFLVFGDEGMAARQRFADDRRRRKLKVVLDIDGRYIQKAQARDMSLRQNGVFREHDDHIVVEDGARQGHSRMQILDGYGFQSKFLLWETACIESRFFRT